MVDGVLEDVVDGVVVLLFGLDHSGPEPPAEDVVLAAVPLVESAGVLAVEITHPVREVGERGLDDEVVVVAEQAVGVQPPAVAAPDALQELKEDAAVPIVQEDGRVVVAFRPDVVEGAGGQVAVRSSHLGDRSRGGAGRTPASAFRHEIVTDPLGARHVTGPRQTRCA